MFHRPPEVDPSFEQESRKNSYNIEENDQEIGTDELIKENNSINELNDLITSLERLQIDSIKLPDELLKEFEKFIKFLKLPKFNRPLNLNDISLLYQQFYRDFHVKNVNYWNHKYGLDEHKENELLTKDEITQRNENLNKAKNQIYLCDLLIEKLVCNKYYKKIIKSDKNLLKDEMNRLINQKLELKLRKLHEVNVTLKNLDYDFVLRDEEILFDQISIIYKKMFEIKSPTLKLLKFKRIHECINQYFKTLIGGLERVNGDLYLPILLYSMIKIDNLSNCDLILELNFIKNFKNNVVYENNNSNETGELLYILTNFDACLIYLLNVTIEDLKIENVDNVEYDEILTKPILIEESTLDYCDDFNTSKKNVAKNGGTLDYYSTRLQEYAYYNADQSIRTIGNAFDSSVKSIFGRFMPFTASTITNTTEIDKETFSQIEENFRSKLDNEVISPISTTSTLNTSTSSSNGVSTSPLQQPVLPLQQPIQLQQHQRSNSNEFRNSSLKQFATSMNGVIKQFRPISNSNSSTSLHTTLEPLMGSSPTLGSAIALATDTRSRGASLIGDVFNLPVRSSSSSIITTLEHAFEGRRSRGNSLLSGNVSMTSLTLISDLKREYKEKKFEEMNINDLKKMYDNYKKIMNCTN